MAETHALTETSPEIRLARLIHRLRHKGETVERIAVAPDVYDAMLFAVTARREYSLAVSDRHRHSPFTFQGVPVVEGQHLDEGQIAVVLKSPGAERAHA